MNKPLAVLSIAVGLSMIGCGQAGHSAVGDGGDAGASGRDLAGKAQDLAAKAQDLAGLVTIADIQTQVFTPHCGGSVQLTYCHVSEAVSYGAGLDLSPGHALLDLVNRPDIYTPVKLLVVPGDPATSFLWQKLNDLQGPSEGRSMPWGEAIVTKLPQDLLDLVNTWITQGAH